MKIFLDDEREPNWVYDPYIYEEFAKDWTVVRSVEEAIKLLTTEVVTAISLDHDLGYQVPTGYDLCKWMTANAKWPEDVSFHSANPVGVKNMMAEWEFYKKYKEEITNGNS